MGKIVATCPASILDPSFSGNLKILKEGANIITESVDILQLLGLSTIHLDKIQNKTVEYLSELTMLEIAGLAFNQGQNFWIKQL